jgi:predicted esterase
VGNFFEIQSVKLLKKAPKDQFGVWLFSTDKKKTLPMEFQPCLEVKATAKDNIRSENLLAKAYFFDQNNKLIASFATPSKSGTQDKGRHHEMPVLFYKDKADRVFFEVPAKIRDSRWKAVVVFGDKNEARSACFPPTETDYLLDYPEKELVYNRTAQRVARKAAMDPLIEHLVKTRNPKMPQITLFLRPPKGISDASEVQGVLAICVLANSLEEMQRDLRKEEMPGDYAGLFSFANKHKLAIVAWGSRRLWDPGRNYDELPREQARNIDESLDIVMNAWERGIKELGDKYGIPEKDFLLWGSCGSAQWAQRLCLRKPDYFLATYIHMPGSFDKPTPEAANVLWCLTIGELEGGYERSKRWVKTVRDMGYPIVYKAIPGLGHSSHPDAAALGFEFYNYALDQKRAQQESQKEKTNAAPSLVTRSSEAATRWAAMFQNPPYYGDMVNQELYPSADVAMIPSGFRIPLPTKKLADIWIRNK